MKLYRKPEIDGENRKSSIQTARAAPQGSQFTSTKFLNCLTADTQISMDSKGRALDNIFVERLWRTIKYEHIYLYAYKDGLSLQRGLTEYFHFYNYIRKHQSLGYQTPAQWYIQGEKKEKSTINEQRVVF